MLERIAYDLHGTVDIGQATFWGAVGAVYCFLGAIAGPILRGGHKYGIDVPTTRALVDRIATLLQ